MYNKIIILDFGSQTTQLIARRVRELNVYCEIVPYNKFPFGDESVKGVILSGSSFSVYDPEAFRTDVAELRGRLPLLGICYGAQLVAYEAGGKVRPAPSREYGRAKIKTIDDNEKLMAGVRIGSEVWMSHGDSITDLPDGFRSIASTSSVQTAAYRVDGELTFGVQFHPEVFHTEQGAQLLGNFIDICGCSRNWTPASFVQSTVNELRETLRDDQVILALSGGVDSTVTAVLLNKAIGSNLTCIFVDHGLLRKNEFEEVLADYEHLGLNVKGVQASDRFFDALRGVEDPEQKRRIIGKGFIEVFEEEANRFKNKIGWLAQGTIYPDVIESLSISGTVIKSHHNVGGLPERMSLKLVEPLRLLFKDEVRKVGTELGITDRLIGRHPFPGPGLGIRVLGEVSPEKVSILQEADYIYMNLLRENGLYGRIWQAGAILLPVRSVGVMGDERTYGYTIALRAVTSTDAMTADWAQLPYGFLSEVSNEIINRVKGVNRVVYDISSKPPSTIEWE